MAVQTVNIINDLSTYSKVPNKILNDLADKMTLCIGSALHDAKLSDSQAVVLNIGIGTLSVELATMQCKFVPSKDLKNAIKASLENGVDPLAYEIEKALVDKLLKIYEEVV